jgi:hypothetical protein
LFIVPRPIPIPPANSYAVAHAICTGSRSSDRLIGSRIDWKNSSPPSAYPVISASRHREPCLVIEIAAL